MSEDKYLINYYKANNPALERLKIKKKLLYKTLIYAICSVLYFTMMALSNLSKYKGEVAIIDALKPLKIIMIISTIIGFIGLVIFFFAIIKPNKFEEIFDKVSFSFKKKMFVIMDWFSVLPICVVITIFCFSYVFLIMQVSGLSMQPTLQDKDHVLVLYNKEVKRGSIVIIEVNDTDYIEKVSPTENWIKRIIGLPGDTIKWTSECKLYINDVLYEEEYFPEDYFNQAVLNPNTSGYTVDGTVSYIDENGNRVPTLVIPEGYYFVMGDHRDNSKDSRHIGLIPEDNIIGVATYVMDYIIPRKKIS